MTLSLAKQSVKLYFETVLGRGKFDKEGREKMRDKYYLTVKQFEKFAPPDLMGTKLHVLDGLDFSGLSSRLQTTHSKLREVVKVLLKNFQTVGELTSIFGELQLGEVYNAQGELHPDYELSALEKYTADDPDNEGSLECTATNFKAILLENSALRRKDADTVIMYRSGILIVLLTIIVHIFRRCVEELDTAIRVAGDGKLFFDKSKDLVWDSLQLVGQCDVYIRYCQQM